MAMGSDDPVAEVLGDPIATQLQPTSEAEAAILAPLVPGNYTAIVRGQGDTSGVALVEAYNLQ